MQEKQGRRLHLSWDLNYSYLFLNDFHFIVFVAVALPSCRLKSLVSDEDAPSTPFPGHFQTLLDKIQICLDNIQCGQINLRPL